MKISISNIGVLRQAEYELGDLTIICGRNNMGKTYATYSLYGFIDFFKNGFFPRVNKDLITELIHTGTCSMHIDFTQDFINNMLKEACNAYKPFLPKIFTAQEKYFEKASFSAYVDISEIELPNSFTSEYKRGNKDFVQISLSHDASSLQFALLTDAPDVNNQSLRISIGKIMGNTLKMFLFSSVFPDTFIASAERTGAVIFKNELDYQKHNLLREIASADEIDLGSILDKMYNTPYPLPVRRNIDFIRNVEGITKSEGILYKKYPEVVEMYNRIIGGKYEVGRDGIRYCPDGAKSVKLQIVESASSIRSLLDVFFYLRYVAKPGDLLMIDEPELNLHPESQREVARLIAALVNIGIKVFITTHSDYIIKELNTLIMLKARINNKGMKTFMAKKGYRENELLSCKQLRVYIADKALVQLDGNKRKSNSNTLKSAIVDDITGISADSFNNTINDINQIQEYIYFN
ncbi:MAG: AAA family ATPase [Muribaculaceae bacterium]|nr:AAA family ATPase [Muribaculaceae bacterium]